VTPIETIIPARKCTVLRAEIITAIGSHVLHVLFSFDGLIVKDSFISSDLGGLARELMRRTGVTGDVAAKVVAVAANAN
jgi:hypothetical protein